jgi:hypothetical protein
MYVYVHSMCDYVRWYQCVLTNPSVLALWLTLLVETFQVFANKTSLLLNSVVFLREKPGRSFYLLPFQHFTISCH